MFDYAKLAGLAFAIHWSFIVDAIAAPDNSADRCRTVRQHCENGESSCSWLRSALTEDGITCPASDTEAFSKGEFVKLHRAAFVATGGTSRDDQSARSPTDILAYIQAGCDVTHGYQTFSSQVTCIKNDIRLSQVLSAATVSDDVQLYTLTADNLVDELGRKRISPTAARVELQKAFLDFRDRVNRQNAETTAKENVARSQAQQAAASAQAAQEREHQRLAAAQAAAEAEQREINRRRDDLVAFCVSEANQRLFANTSFAYDNLQLGLFPIWKGTYHNVDRLCANDTYWYKQVPPPQKVINCSPGWGGGVNCTEQ